MSSMSSSLRARTTPYWRTMPSNTASSPANDPVCDAAARAPAPKRPTLVTTSGLPISRAFAATRVRPAPSVSPSIRSEEHTSELQSLMRNSYAVFCLKKKKYKDKIKIHNKKKEQTAYTTKTKLRRNIHRQQKEKHRHMKHVT